LRFHRSSLLSSRNRGASQVSYSFIIALARKGRSHLMLNTTKKEERLAKEAEEESKWEDAERHMKEMKEEIEELRKELEQRDENRADADKNAGILHELFESKVIDSEGNLIQ
jgi:DNA-binding transcriptional regulator GbsR (MarR family)